MTCLRLQTLTAARPAIIALLAAAAGFAAAAAGGCVTEGKKPPPPPRAIPDQPADVQPDRLVRFVGLPEDTDRSGFGDQIPVTVYLFSSGYSIPLHVPGRFVFRLADMEGRELARWDFDEAQSEAARRTFVIGPGYTFSLSLLDLGIERLEVREPLLYIAFIPGQGRTIEPRAGTTVFLGGSMTR